MRIRNRTYTNILNQHHAKFGQKKPEVVADCIVINGDFQTGDLTGWEFDNSAASAVRADILLSGTNYYCRLHIVG